MKKIKLGLIICLTLIMSCGWTLKAFDVPEPLDNFYVADYANVISEEAAEQIRRINVDLEKTNGAQIVVATLDFLNGEDIADVAYDLFNGWGVGSAENNNGVLLVLAIGEEDYYCIQGSGLEQTLSSGMIDDLLYNYLEDDFAAEKYSEGVLKTVQQLASIVEKTAGTPVVTEPEVRPTVNPTRQPAVNPPAVNKPNRTGGIIDTFMSLIFGGIALFVVVVFAVAIFSIRRPSYGPRPPRRPRYWRRAPHYHEPVRRREPYHSHYHEPVRPREPRRPSSGGGFFGSSSSHTSSSSSSHSSSAGRSTGLNRGGGGSVSRSSGSGRASSGMNKGGGGTTRGGGAGRRKK